MDGAFKNAIIKEREEPNELVLAIRDICARIERVNAHFDMESDEDLIEACIYEREALRARYRFLLRQARTQGVSAGNQFNTKQ